MTFPSSLQEKDKNYKSIYKSIQVIKRIYSEKKSQIQGSIGGISKDPMAKKFLDRATKQQKIVTNYSNGNYKTPETKLMCLHEIANSFTFCFADCEEDYEDDHDSEDEEDNVEQSEN